MQSYKAAKEQQSRIQSIKVSYEAKQAITKCSHAAPVRQALISLLLKTLTAPYFEEDDMDEENEEQYVMGQANAPDYAIEDSECLKISKIFDFPLVSSNAYPWQVCNIEGHLAMGAEHTEHRWANVYDGSSPIDCHEELLASLAPATPPESGLAPQEVEISIQKHHGKEVLERFAPKIAAIPYVTRIESDEWRAYAKRFFIKSSLVDNCWYVHLTLYREDRGFSYLVRTTARNKYEADFIGNELENLY